MKTKENKTWYEMTKEEREKCLGEATRKAIAETHAAGRSTAHGDSKGVYLLYPDGHKEYIKLYEEKEQTKEKAVTAGCAR